MERYIRQTMLPEVGEQGQNKLLKARVLIVGVGGLGSPVSIYLTGAGVGTIGLIDDDNVSESNLQRQILYTENEIGTPKALCAKRRLEKLNSSVTIECYCTRLTEDNAGSIMSDYDIIVDGCDNYQTRYLISDMCEKLGKVYVYGAICAFDGQVSVFDYKKGLSYRMLYPDEQGMLDMPPQPKGVIGVTPGVVGVVEANEVIKYICGFGESLCGKLWSIDLRNMQTNIIDFA